MAMDIIIICYANEQKQGLKDGQTDRQWYVMIAIGTYGHKSHIRKKCFTPKQTQKCIYFVSMEHTVYYEHLTHTKVYIF